MAASPTSTGSTAGNIPSVGSAPATGGVLGTVSNFQQTAGQNIGNAGATALAQIAAAGSRGQAAIKQAQDQNAAAKTAALQTVMQTAALHGAPIGNIQANQETAVAPLVSRAQDLAAMGANYGANNQGLQAANANYFAGLQGALPIDQAAITTDITNDQAKNAQAAMSANVKLATEQAALAAANAKLNPTLTPAQILSQLGGAQLAGQQFNQQATQGQNALEHQQETRPAGQMGPPLANLGAAVNSPVAPLMAAQQQQDQSTSYGNIDKALGLPPGYSQSVANNSEQASQDKANTAIKSQISTANAEFAASNAGTLSNAKFVASVVNGKNYQTGLKNAATMAAAGQSEAQIQQKLVADGMDPNAATVVAVNGYKLQNNTGTA